MTLFGITNSAISLTAVQAGIAAQCSALQLQPYIGSDDQRANWFHALERADQLVNTPSGSIASMFGLHTWKLHRAVGILKRVESQTCRAGLLIAGLQDGLASNAARFREHAISSEPEQDGTLYVIDGGTVREEYPHEKAGRLVGRLLNSELQAQRTLVAILDRAFEAHIAQLDRQVGSIDEIIKTRKIPDNASYPRYFEHAHPRLMRFLRSTLSELNDGVAVPWSECEIEILSYAINRKWEQEGIDAKTAGEAGVKRGLSIALQIPDYSSFQLLCLLLQIRNDSVDNELVEQLRGARDGRIIELGRANAAGVRFDDILKASELVGNIDIIHANLPTAYELARQEAPDTDPRFVARRVMSAVARLGKATGLSRAEYDDSIKTLREIEANRNYGTVVSLLDR